jgi:pyruvate,orthophosphate dikinase
MFEIYTCELTDDLCIDCRIPDGILNLGVNDEVVDAIVVATHGNERFALDTQRRFLSNFGTIVLGANPSVYHNIVHDEITHSHLQNESELTSTHLHNIVKKFKEYTNVPDDVYTQLYMTIEMMFRTWGVLR